MIRNPANELGAARNSRLRENHLLAHEIGHHSHSLIRFRGIMVRVSRGLHGYPHLRGISFLILIKRV
jgi:hypothetical protein